MNDDDFESKVAALFSSTGEMPNKIKMLIVDDNAVDLQNMARITQQTGLRVEVESASSIGEFEQSLAKSGFDLVCVDFCLPDGNGLEAQAILRSNERNSHAAVIMVAGEGQIQVAVAALKTGCSDYIIKEDLTPATLRRAMLNALHKSTLANQICELQERLGDLHHCMRTLAVTASLELRPQIDNALAKFIDGTCVDAAIDNAVNGETALTVMDVCRKMQGFCDEVSHTASRISH